MIVQATIENEGIKIIEDFHSTTMITTYGNEVKQVILDIIKNAKDAFRGQEIKDPTIWIHTSDSESQAIIQIEDNAGGIDSEIIEKIFEPYFTTKEEYNGSGLGLYMSKTIIEEHCGGKLKVHNIPGGACFELIFHL